MQSRLAREPLSSITNTRSLRDKLGDSKRGGDGTVLGAAVVSERVLIKLSANATLAFLGDSPTTSFSSQTES